MGACHCTSDGQEHKIIWLAGPELLAQVAKRAERAQLLVILLLLLETYKAIVQPSCSLRVG